MGVGSICSSCQVASGPASDLFSRYLVVQPNLKESVINCGDTHSAANSAIRSSGIS